MPAPLPDPYRRITVRVPVDDLDLLTLAHPRQVNEVIRALVHTYAERLRANLSGEPRPPGAGVGQSPEG